MTAPPVVFRNTTLKLVRLASMVSQDAEYSCLRSEITSRVGIQYQTAIFAYTATAAIWALILEFAVKNLEVIMWPAIFGIPMWICLFAGKLINHNTEILVEIAGYLKKFYEEDARLDKDGRITTVSWERLHGEKDQDLRRREAEEGSKVDFIKKDRCAFKDPYQSIVLLWIVVMAVSAIPMGIIAISCCSLDADLMVFDFVIDYNLIEWAIGAIAYIFCVLVPCLYMLAFMRPKQVNDHTFNKIDKIWEGYPKHRDNR